MLKSGGQQRSIGEVLALLRTEFADVSISKIRFLESQGLVNPERTASGYRKFRDDDVARLRYILRQQKEHFLPLKVIKGRLTQNDERTPAEQSPIPLRSEGSDAGGFVDRAGFLSATNLTEGQTRELEGFGLLTSEKSSSNGSWYSADAVLLGKIAERFFSFGVDARHLRIFKTGADREADLYRQMTGASRTPKRGQAQIEAAARLEELSNLGQALHIELLRQALEHH